MARDFLSEVDFKSTVTHTSTDAGSSAGPVIELYRNSASPADADYIGQIKFQGENDNDQKVIYAKITGKIDDASDGSEDGIIEIAHQKAGSNNISARFTSDALKLINGTGLEVAGTIQIDGATTFGVDDTGVDVKFFGATSGRYMEWDESEDSLALVDNVKLTLGSKAGGDGNIKHTGSNLQISETTGNIQITNYNTDGDIVLSSDDGSGGETAYITVDGGSVQTTIHKTLQLDATLNVGVDDTGYDVKFFGATASKYMLWDESADALIVKDTVDAVNFKVNGGQGSDGQVLTSTGSGVAWENASGGGGSPGGSDHQVQFNNNGSFGADANFTYDGSNLTAKVPFTVGVDDTGHDVKFFGAASGAYMLYDESENRLDVVTASGAAYFRSLNGTATTYIGSDSGNTALFGTSSAHDTRFITNDTERMRILSGGNVGIGTASPETPLNIVTTNKLGSTFTGTVDGEGLRVDQSDYSAGNYVSLVEASYQDDQTAPHVRIAAMFDGTGSHLVFGTSNSYASGITNTAMEINETGEVTMPKLVLTDTTDTGSDTSDGALTIGATTGQHLSFDGNEIISKSDDSTMGDLHLQTDGGDVKFGNNTALSHFKVCANSGAFEVYSTSSALELHNTTAGDQSVYHAYYNDSNARFGYMGYPANDDMYFKNENAGGQMYSFAPGSYMYWHVAGAYELRLSAAELRPYSNEGLNLGASGAAWNHFYLGQGSTFSSGGYWTLRSRDSDRQVMEYTSSERFKKDIVDLPLAEAYQVLDARPIKFRGIDDDSSVPLEAGLSAESLHNSGFEYAVRYDEGHWGETPRSVYYEMLTAPLIKICKDQKDRIESLEAKVAALEAA